MSQATRQSELFAGNDWTAIYKAFTEVNLNAFDFDSIRSSMVNYIQQNYPEDYNDWIDSSEFIAILDLLAYLGQALAFRIDINARENFLSVARRRESVLRLARFLSYPAKRNYPSRGLAKLTEIKTTQDVYDSMGRNLNNQVIRWDDANNPDWFEQWILVMNASFVTTNPFGVPLAQAVLNGINTQLYRFESIAISAGNYPFNTTVNNTSLPFDAVNPSFNTTFGFVEQLPDPTAKFHVIYQSDGNGNSSANTGFFVYFKQGTLQHQDYSISDPQENRTILVNTQNINETDVWVQTVLDDGTIDTNGNWTRVGYVPSDEMLKVVLTTENVTYNDVSPDVQNIYQVVTQENDQIVLRFGDGRFGQIPTGNLRVWYRVSANQNLTIRPDDMQNVQIAVPYTTPANVSQNLTLSFSLQNTVSNSVVSETNDDVRRRASRVAATQGRMVSGEDYNQLPIQTNLALKIKAINRVYSGQSRYIDLNDPTGTYQNTNVFGDDGSLYQERNDFYQEVSLADAPTAQQLIGSYIQPIMARDDLKDFLYSYWIQETENEGSSAFDFWLQSDNIVWQTRTDSTNQPRAYYELGQFAQSSAPSTALEFGQGFFQYVTNGAMIKFQNAGWVAVTSTATDTNGNLTQARLSEAVGNGDQIIRILPAFMNSVADSSSLQSQLTDRLNARRGFGLCYDFTSLSWYILDIAAMSTSPDYQFTIGNNNPQSWLIKAEYGAQVWRFSSRGLNHVFESTQTCKFFFVNDYKTIDPNTGQVGTDSVRIMKANGLSQDVFLTLSDTYTYSDGYMEPRRVKTQFQDSNDDGLYDNPESYSQVLALNEQGWVVHQTQTSTDGYDYQQLIQELVNPAKPQLGNLIYGYLVNQDDTITFYQGSDTNGNQSVGSFDPADTLTDQTVVINNQTFTVTRGITNLVYQWKHFVPTDHRIDPSITNIIDIFVLTRGYYDLMTTWRDGGMDPTQIPTPPTELQLKMDFNQVEEFKMFSDEIVWRPSKFKLMFGVGADPVYQAKFQVIKVPGTTLSDGEIKSQIIQNIQDYFDVNNWDFGETFYYTELASYIHRQMATAISSIVIVPVDDRSFGNLFSVDSQPDEIFFPTAQVSDIEIISAFTNTNLRIR